MKNNGGMTLVEVLMALLITFIVFLGLSSAGLVVFNENIKNDLRDEAVSVAAMEVGFARNTPFDNLVAVADGAPRSIDNVVHRIRGLSVNYGVVRTVNFLDGDTVQVSIDVAWSRTESDRTRSYTHNVATIVRR